MRQEDRAVAKEILSGLLSAAKIQTMSGIYDRIEPGQDGRLRTSLSVVGTISGRFSSSETFLEPASTNLQNIPKATAKLDPLYNVRACLTPDPGMILLEADFSQAELYAYLAFAGDWKKIERLKSGEDLHRLTASKIYSSDPSSVSGPERIVGKFANYGLGYGAGWKTFRESVNHRADITGVTIDAPTARRAVEVWRKMNRRTVEWWDRIEDEMRTSGQLRNPFGRVRTLIDRSGRALNSAISWLPQSTVADALNHGLKRVYYDLDPEAGSGEFELLLQVHDSVVGQCPIGEWRKVVETVRGLMTRPVEINGRSVPIPVEIEVSSRSWAEVREI